MGEDLVAALHFYPDSVTGVIGDARNPNTLIKKLARPEDVVVFKLDVDTAPVETAIMQQVVGDSELRLLVDEFFFEMHLCHHVMRKHGMDCDSPKIRAGAKKRLPSMDTWYGVAGPARERGLRMHY